MRKSTQIVAAMIIFAGAVFAAGKGAPQGGAASGPFATKATVEIDDAKGPIQLKREEQIAVMFMDAISNLEGPCIRNAGHACKMDELVAGAKAKDGTQIGKLKFDPRTTDPNYNYMITVNGTAWQAWATPRKPGLGGLYYFSKFGGIATSYYKAGSGPATEKDTAITGSSINGDLFWIS
jgi:hypothetical protein